MIRLFVTVIISILLLSCGSGNETKTGDDSVKNVSGDVRNIKIDTSSAENLQNADSGKTKTTADSASLFRGP